MGRHRRPGPADVSPLETRPDTAVDGSWLASAEGGAEALDEARSAAFTAFWDLADDGDVSERSRERLARAGRTLLQGALAAIAVGVAPVLLDALRGDSPDLRTLSASAGTAAVAALVAYVHPKR